MVRKLCTLTLIQCKLYCGWQKGVCVWSYKTFHAGRAHANWKSTSHVVIHRDKNIFCRKYMNFEMNIHQKLCGVKFVMISEMVAWVEALSFAKQLEWEKFYFLNIHFWLNTFVIRQKLAAALSLIRVKPNSPTRFCVWA
jgi:hypothetical protein